MKSVVVNGEKIRRRYYFVTELDVARIDEFKFLFRSK